MRLAIFLFLLPPGYYSISYKNQGIKDKPVLIMILCVFAVGIGSSLFHSFANKLAMYADVIPIMLLVLIYLFFAQIYLLKFSRSQAALGLASIILASIATGFLPSELKFNGSASYFPCLAAIFLLAWKSHEKILYWANIIFCFSLIFRSIDMVECEQLSIGTHFLWHLLNGLLLYLLVKILINHCAAARSV